MTLKELEEKRADLIAKRKSITAELEQLKAQEADLESAAKDAAAGDDIDTFLHIRDEQRRVAAMIEMCEIKLQNTSDRLPEADIEKTWKRYASDHDKAIAKAREKMDKCKAAFLDAFRELVILQNEGLKARKTIAGLVGIDQPEIAARFPMTLYKRPEVSDFPNCLAFRGRNMMPELALYSVANPNTKAGTVLEACVPVEEGAI